MSSNVIKISVIIVNYNVKDFLEQALLSLKRALSAYPSEIIVVDNASVDGSVPMLKKRFPDIQVIENDKNVGFSAANNQAIKIAKGEYIVLLNPDTVVQEDTFKRLFDFFKQNPRASAATCKILNPDGTFSVDCRHSIPTPLVAFWKVTGLAGLFPKSKLFGKYNLTYLDENETYQVEAISGSFMMIKRKVVEKIGLLDERFFMYCEDIDYCHRINQAGGEIYYVPTSQIIHYKGESTKKDNLDYIITFNRSLYKFYEKHYQQKYIYPFKWLILLGIIFRGLIIFSRNFFRKYYPFILDFAILNISIFFSFFIRMEMKTGFSLDSFFQKQIIINAIASAAFFIAVLFFDNLNRNQHSISRIIKVNFAVYTFIAALTFFLKQFAFSRLVVVFSSVFSTVFMSGWRMILRYLVRKSAHALGHDFFLKRTLIVGSDKQTKNLLEKLKKRIDSGLDISGVVTLNQEEVGQKLAGFPVVTSIKHLPQYLRLNKINLVVFSTHNLSYETILSTMARINRPEIEFKIVPEHLEFMIGKSEIDRLDNVPLIDIQYASGRPFNRFVKRTFDILTACLLLIPISPVGVLLYIKNRGKIHIKYISVKENKKIYLKYTDASALLQFVLDLWQIIKGKLSFVGADAALKKSYLLEYGYKPGLTGIVQINPRKGHNADDIEELELYYLKNQNLLMDLEILFSALFKLKLKK